MEEDLQSTGTEDVKVNAATEQNKNDWAGLTNVFIYISSWQIWAGRVLLKRLQGLERFIVKTFQKYFNAIY